MNAKKFRPLKKVIFTNSFFICTGLVIVLILLLNAVLPRYFYKTQNALNKDISVCINDNISDILSDVSYIYSELSKDEELVKNISLEEGCYKVTPSYSCGNVVSYGTGSVIDIYDDGEMLFSYTLILDGDVNGDGYVDALDCHVVGLAQKNLVEIEDENYSMAAAWFDGSDGVSAQDYQAVVNKALS